MKTGKHNLITDVPGIKVGNAQDMDLQSGVTVFTADTPFTAAVDIRGGAPGARETALLDPSCTVKKLDAIALAGGSAWGLNAADGVMDYLKSKGRGLAWKDALIPLVPCSILFDLLNGGNKDWHKNPYYDLGFKAATHAAEQFELGSVGAGTGAKAGKLKGGLGSASFIYKDRFSVGALVAANPIGSVLMPNSQVFWAWPFEQQGEYGGHRPNPHKKNDTMDYPFDMIRHVQLDRQDGEANMNAAIENTSIAIIATDLALDKAEALRIAMAAQDGLARAIRPVHTPLDGDTVYMVSTGQKQSEHKMMDMARLAMLAADCLARAVARAIYHASSLGIYTSYRDKYGQ